MALLKAVDVCKSFQGNLAVDQDMFLHIIIRTWTEIDDNPSAPGGVKPPYTGDGNQPVVWIALAAAALAGLIVLLLLARRDKKRKADES